MKTRKELEKARIAVQHAMESYLACFEAHLEKLFVPLSNGEMISLREVHEKLKGRRISVCDALSISGERIYRKGETGEYEMCSLRQKHVLRCHYNRIQRWEEICECLLSAINYRGDGEEIPAYAKPKLEALARQLSYIGYRID